MHRPFSRRRFLGVLAAGSILATVRPALATGRSAPSLLDHARRELTRLGDAIPRRDVVGIADYSLASAEPRFHLVDMNSGAVRSFLVSHGRGSDPAHLGFVQRFSNAPGSNASSEGAYRTSDYYSGRHGRSMRLVGLDATNCNAEQRAIVVHGAWYVSPAMVRERGVLGRSQGCFAFAEAELDTILTRLGPGRLLISTKL
ncbi:MAG TPA: murein L,D-transpeptidase catalytic domain family protein [Povalibacter sp.]|uniref:murein L,D-transpeptidase catalytic domain family protein n=1 Tax=Povalibacter sp. TaxID=1962978 RepID=UPI002C9F7E32|nr:murein L,D-transpeptidase catalytic domain family protein [Povalibacter sp.]HMN43524.1 murein L,D-transpeptidase catalytic domain family protein [Povalibacter sp.]